MRRGGEKVGHIFSHSRDRRSRVGNRTLAWVSKSFADLESVLSICVGPEYENKVAETFK
jgi:hypothetical protein